MKQHYQTLEVNEKATQREIRTAYQKKALQYHPDRGEGNEEMMQEVNAAYEVLKDPERRKMYDRFGDRSDSFLQGQGVAGGIVSRTGVFTPAAIIATIVAIYVLGFLFFSLFVPLKVDSKISLDWGASFLGIWVMSFVHVVAAILLLLLAPILTFCSRDGKFPGQRQLGLLFLFYGLVFACLVVGAVTVYLLVNVNTSKALLSFIPFLVMCVLIVFVALAQIALQQVATEAAKKADAELEPEDRPKRKRKSTSQIWIFGILQSQELYFAVGLFAALILLGLRLDGQSSVDYLGPALIPPVALLIRHLVSFVVNFSRTKMCAAFVGFFTQTFALTVFFLPPILGAAKADGDISADLIICFIPWIIIGALLVILALISMFTTCLLACCTPKAAPEDEEGEKHEPNEAGHTPHEEHEREEHKANEADHTTHNEYEA